MMDGIVPVLFRLQELLNASRAELQTGPFGTMLHASSYVPNGVPVVAVKNIGLNRLIHDEIPRISADDAARLSRYRLCENDILFSRKGAVERRALIRRDEAGWLQGSDCIRLRFDDTVDPEYVSYYLGSPQARQWLLQHAHGATMPSLNQEILRLLPIPLPNIGNQRAIAHILGTLDDKIELNRRMNQTLEAIARALFTSWFVDFDPVRAKAEGRQPTGLAFDGAECFSNSFVESSVGQIPSGWSLAPLGDHVVIEKGRSYRRNDLAESTTALVTLKSFHRGGGYRGDGLKPYTGDYKPTQVVSPGEIVIALTDVTQAAEVIGRPAMVRPDARFVVLVASLDVGIVRSPSKRLPTSFLYGLLSSQRFTENALAHTSGTTVLHLNSRAVTHFPAVLPDQRVLHMFETATQPLQDKIAANEHENESLGKLRDALLPKLLSGGLRVVEGNGLMGTNEFEPWSSDNTFEILAPDNRLDATSVTEIQR
jgi:type I restriction enzyme S subunit